MSDRETEDLVYKCNTQLHGFLYGIDVFNASTRGAYRCFHTKIHVVYTLCVTFEEQFQTFHLIIYATEFLLYSIVDETRAMGTVKFFMSHYFFYRTK